MFGHKNRESLTLSENKTNVLFHYRRFAHHTTQHSHRYVLLKVDPFTGFTTRSILINNLKPAFCTFCSVNGSMHYFRLHASSKRGWSGCRYGLAQLKLTNVSRQSISWLDGRAVPRKKRFFSRRLRIETLCILSSKCRPSAANPGTILFLIKDRIQFLRSNKYKLLNEITTIQTHSESTMELEQFRKIIHRIENKHHSLSENKLSVATPSNKFVCPRRRKHVS